MPPESLAAIVVKAIDLATAPLVARIAALEKAAPLVGRDGRDGAPGVKGEPGERGIDGTNGRDGVDGLGFDDLLVTHDGGRTVTLSFIKGDQRKDFPLTLPIPEHTGKWDAGRAYDRGQEVMWAGSSWRAQEPTKAEPGTAAPASRAWVMVARRGDIGKSGTKGEKGERGPVGPDGPRGAQGYGA